jgi:hypothetical protein
MLAFTRQHAPILELLRARRTPLADTIPLCHDPSPLRTLAARAADPAFASALRAALQHSVSLGAMSCPLVAVLAGDGTGDSIEVVPQHDGMVALFLEHTADDTDVLIALGRALALFTRWSAADSASAIAREHARPDRWEGARDFPLAEWIYAEGVALHFAAVMATGAPIERVLGISRRALARLRERETALRHLLGRDLDQRGIGLLLRWLSRDAPAGARRVDGAVLPVGAGSYLAWRMVQERVSRVGIGAALRMEID